MCSPTIICTGIITLFRSFIPVRAADLIPSPKRVKDSGYLADVEVDHREISLRDDVIVRAQDGRVYAYADALRRLSD
ncbi:hypothetical protein Tco_0228541 [Tanacetum coccineum]